MAEARGTPFRPRDRAPLSAGTLVDYFRVIRLLGRGGMGEVYLARDTRLARRVALKVVRPELLTSPDAIDQFLFEARAAARLGHPHIVTVYAVGEFERGPYIAFEYLEGRSLRDRLRERPGRREAMRIGRAVAEALAEAHRHHLVHGDLKPENIVVPRDGRLRVIDFGLARFVQRGATVEEAAGTPAYMAPEQARGGASTPKTDVWALGVTLCELLFGSPRIPDPAAEIPPPLRHLVARCLSEEEEERPSAAEVATALEDLLAAGVAAPGAERNPFRGLLPFTEEHADLFFGRDAEISAFLERLREEPILPVVGPSGAGKSSFVQAGVIPRLQEQGRWAVLHLQPGTDPLASLSRRLAPDAAEEARADLAAYPRRLGIRLRAIAAREEARVLLIVDPLEEIYTLVEDRNVRVAFLEAICTAADDRDDPVRIVLGLRDDFLGRVAETPEAREALSRLMVLRAPGPEALEETLVRPVAAAGYAYEDPSVVREMVAAVGTEPAGLPLLQFAAHALWERRDRASRLLRRSAYEAMGGVPGALADHADGVLEELAPGEIQLARAILLRLVTPQRTRGVLRRGRLLDGLPSEAERILDRLARARLVTVRATSGYGPQEPEIELAHESIIGAWKRLARWLDESAGEHAWLAEVRPVAERWERRGRRAEEVWRGEVLRESVRMLARCGAPVPTAVRDFLEAGQRVERRRQTRRRALWAGALAALVAVTAASVWGALAFREKERQARHRWADVQQEAARAAMLRGEMLEAMARLRGSLEIRDSLLGRALWNDLAQAPLLGTWRLSGSAFAAALSPDGRTLAVAGQDKAVHLFDLPTWLPRVLRGVDEQYQSVAFSPDGRRLAAGTIGGPVVVWDLLSGRFQQLSGHVGRVFGVAFHPTGRWLASAGLDGQIRLRDLDGGSPPRILRGHRGRVNRLAFHPRRGLLASAGVDGSVRIWDVDAGTPPRVLSGHTDTVFDVAFDPAGTRLASGSYDGTARIWDVTTGFAPTGVLDHGEPVYPVAFSRDGRLLASGGHSGSIRLWDARTRTPAAVLDAPPTRVWGLAFDTRRLISASEDGGVRLWSLRARAVAPPRAGHRGAVVDLAFAADGSRIASASYDGTVRLWDARSGRQLRVLRGHTHRVFGVAIDDRRGLLASGGSDGTIRLWDLASGAVRKVLSGPTDLVFDVVFHPHRELLLSAGLDRVVRLWDLHTGALRRELAGHRDRISSLDVSLDGRLVASASYDGTLRVWDLVAGGPPRILAGHEGAIDGVAFDPTGRYLASASQDRSVRLWDLGSGKGRIVGRHPARVYRVAFHPRGEWLASAGSDGTARLWNLRGSSRILRGHRSEVNHVAFAPDGAHLATASDDGTVRWWTFPEGRPAWRAPALFASSLELATHRGWVALGEGARLRGDRWRRAIEREARWASESGAFLCVATFDDRVALWDKASDRPLWAHVAPGVRQIVGAPGECLVVAGEEALRYRPGGSTLLARPARAVAERGGRILIAQEASLILLEPSGARRTWAAKRPGLTAVALAGGTAYAGHEAGSLERHSLSGPASGEHLTLEDAPTSPVTRILPGPRDTLIVGFANGTVGVWTADGAASLMQARLHGPIAHLAWKDAKLHVATELGDYATIDLRSLGAPYCDLLREVWRWVGEAWEGGRSVSRPPPPDHPCWRARSE